MKIFDYFKQLTLTQDQKKVLKQLHFFLESDAHVFILQGYAGSGKISNVQTSKNLS